MNEVETGPDSAGRIVVDPFVAERKYSIIYADPPWVYRDKALAGRRGVQFKYPLMSDQAIADLPVKRIVADDAALFLWVTWPKLAETLGVVESWGFTYRTVGFVWVKRTVNGKLAWGMGSATRANTEPCLLGVRGRLKRQSAGVHQVVEATLGQHSVKPHEVRERITQLYGDLPRIELFARDTSAGWDAWGNELDASDAAPRPKAIVPAAAVPAAPATPAAPPGERPVPVDIDALGEAVVRRMRDTGRITRREIRDRWQLPNWRIALLMSALVRDSRVRLIGRGRGAHYVLPEER